MKLKIILITALLATSLNIFAADSKTEIATFAGGCFWCMEPPFDKLDGVEATLVLNFSSDAVDDAAPGDPVVLDTAEPRWGGSASPADQVNS